MDHQHLQHILASVERSSRYLGTEKNTVHKPLNEVRLHIALAFPDLYEIGTSHFGLQILYQRLNRFADIYAERVFAPGHDMEQRLRSSRTPLFSLESKTPLNRFDIVGFSLLYELNFTNILNMLELSNIPFYARQRDVTHPMVIAGGPCTSNPEPVAEFFDAMVIGDGETAIVQMAERWRLWHDNPPLDKDFLLDAWANIEGVYIPSFFEPRIGARGVHTLHPRRPDYTRVKRAIEPDLNTAEFPLKPVVPYGKPVHDRLRLEISRGCTRGCRFCQAGMIYRPVRERSVAQLCRISATSIQNTGYDDLSLLSLSTGDYSQIDLLVAQLMRHCRDKRTAISLPSLRADTVSTELMQAIKAVRKTGFTFAPEAGSQRLRGVINKNLSEREIIDTVTTAFQQGWRLVKLYFMIGLPTETPADVEEIVKLVHLLRKIRRQNGAYGQLNVSIATFIPKSHTPFQWAPQLTLDESKARIERVRHQTRLAGVRFKHQAPEVSLIEGLWARGDRRLSSLLVHAHRSGCRHDAWSDRFDFETWRQVCQAAGIDIAHETARERSGQEPLPWDHIDIGVDKAYLRREFLKATEGRATPDCRHGDCQGCGVCDFDRIAPVLSRSTASALPAIESPPPANAPPPEPRKRTLVYSKMGQARYFSQLELVNLFSRAIHQADIPVKYSEGFHPKPKLSFNDPLPVGVESEHEMMTITVQGPVQAGDLVDRINRFLPEGLNVTECGEASRYAALREHPTATYTVETRNGRFDPQRLQWFRTRREVMIQRMTKRGRPKHIDLKKSVQHLDVIDDRTLIVVIGQQPEARVRPDDVLRHVFHIPDPLLGQMRIIKRAPDRSSPMPLGRIRGTSPTLNQDNDR